MNGLLNLNPEPTNLEDFEKKKLMLPSKQNVYYDSI